MAVAFRFPSILVSGESQETRPKLTLVANEQKRYFRAFVLVATLIGAMFMVVTLRTKLADQQMKIDKLNYDISRARQHFDQLRADRARLQSPEQLIAQARVMGMVPSRGVKVVSVPAAVAAEVAATVGKVDADVVAPVQTPLDEFGHYKAKVASTP